MSEDGPFGLGIAMLFVGGALALVVVTIILLLGMTIVGQMVTGLGGASAPENVTTSTDPVTGEAVSFASTAGSAEVNEIYSVVDSTGFAVGLAGTADSYVASDSEIVLPDDDTWSVSTWAQANATRSMPAMSVDGRVVIQYNDSVSEWRGWYYDEGGRNSYVVSVAAPDQPDSLSLVTVTRNQTHLWIYANTTRGDVENVTVANIESINTSVQNWNGTLDESRVFDDVTTGSRQSSLYNNPVAPRPGRDRLARLMYDEGGGDYTEIYFTDATATISNGSWVNGLDGNELVSGVDYTADRSAGEITALGGGAIDGAPAVWLTYNYSAITDVGEVAETFRPAFELFASAPLVIPAVVVIAAVFAGLLKFTSVASGGSRRRRGNR